MNADILKKAGIDYDLGVKRFVGRANLFEKALSKFAKDSTFSRISKAYEDNDREQLLACAHEFKGVCGNIGLTSLYEASSSLVQTLRAGSFSDAEIAGEYDTLKEKYDAVYKAVVSSMEDAI